MRRVRATCLTLDVRVGGSPLKVHLDRAAAETALGDLIAWPAFERLDQDLKAAVLDAALARPLAIADGSALRAEVVLDRVPDGTRGADVTRAGRENAAPQELLCEVRFSDTEIVRCSVMIEVDRPAAAFRDRTSSPNCVGRATAEGCPAQSPSNWVTPDCPKPSFRSLEPGDIVLFDRCYLADDRLRVNVCDRVSGVGTLDGSRLTLVEPEV